MISLYPFQNEIIEQAREQLREHQSVLMVMPCRSGKTVTASKMIQSAQEKHKRTWFVVHRDFLLDQTSKTLGEFSIRHSFIAAGRSYNPSASVFLCSVQTLRNRLNSLDPPDFIITDESHHVVAPSYVKYIAWATGAKHVGLTASPILINGAGLGKHYESMVCGPQVSWLIANGFLTPFRAYAPSAPNLDGVHTRMGDYVNSEIEGIMDGSAIIGDMVRHWKERAEGMRSLYFAVSVKHSQHIAEQFNAAGIPAIHIDAETPSGARAEAARKLARRQILIIVNCNIAAEGYDLSSQADEPVSVECVGLTRPTQSIGLHIQQSTRSLTPAEGKEHGVILDHAGNLMREYAGGLSGLPDADRQWSLRGIDKRKSTASAGPAVTQCASCFGVHRAGLMVCPYCGAGRALQAREVEEVAGELREIDRAAMQTREADRKAAEKQEQFEAKTLAELIQLGRRRSYKNPGFWAINIMKGRAAHG